ncbi:MAG: hypothetical protein AAF493_00075 [Pseudomonadota bacterium]
MTIDDARLLAYVDGELSVDEAEALELALRADPEASIRLASLRNLPQDVGDALDALLERPIPESLRASVSKPPTSTRSLWPVGAVATFLLGFALALLWQSYAARQPVAADDWIELVASYQAPYARNTVAGLAPDDDTVRATASRLGRELGAELIIPDLREFGLAFKRGQILEVAGNPLAQLVYLPSEGKPVAYCVFRVAGANESPQTARLRGLNLVHWQHDGVGHLVIGDAPTEILERAATRIRSG